MTAPRTRAFVFAPFSFFMLSWYSLYCLEVCGRRENKMHKLRPTQGQTTPGSLGRVLVGHTEIPAANAHLCFSAVLFLHLRRMSRLAFSCLLALMRLKNRKKCIGHFFPRPFMRALSGLAGEGCASRSRARVVCLCNKAVGARVFSSMKKRYRVSVVVMVVNGAEG